MALPPPAPPVLAPPLAFVALPAPLAVDPPSAFFVEAPPVELPQPLEVPPVALPVPVVATADEPPVAFVEDPPEAFALEAGAPPLERSVVRAELEPPVDTLPPVCSWLPLGLLSLLRPPVAWMSPSEPLSELVQPQRVAMAARRTDLLESFMDLICVIPLRFARRATIQSSEH